MLLLYCVSVTVLLGVFSPPEFLIKRRRLRLFAGAARATPQDYALILHTPSPSPHSAALLHTIRTHYHPSDINKCYVARQGIYKRRSCMPRLSTRNINQLAATFIMPRHQKAFVYLYLIGTRAPFKVRSLCGGVSGCAVHCGGERCRSGTAAPSIITAQFSVPAGRGRSRLS